MKPKRKSTGIRSSSGKGTISKTENLGWAFKNKKDPVGCVYIERNTGTPLRNDDKASEPGCFTFDEWKAAGYWVIKGSKSRSRNSKNVPIFGLDQVWTNDKKARPPVAMRTVAQHYSLPAKPVPAPASYPPVKKPWTDWSQPSGLVREVLGRLAKKEEKEDAAHMHMPETFEPSEDDFADLPY